MAFLETLFTVKLLPVFTTFISSLLKAYGISDVAETVLDSSKDAIDLFFDGKDTKTLEQEIQKALLEHAKSYPDKETAKAALKQTNDILNAGHILTFAEYQENNYNLDHALTVYFNRVPFSVDARTDRYIKELLGLYYTKLLHQRDFTSLIVKNVHVDVWKLSSDTQKNFDHVFRALSTLEQNISLPDQWQDVVNEIRSVATQITIKLDVIASELKEIKAHLTDVEYGLLSLPLDDVELTPRGLLLAQNRAVDFIPRAEEQENLTQWLNSSQAYDVRTYQAEGGMGKTRFLLHMCDILRSEGWLARFLATDPDEKNSNTVQMLKKLVQHNTKPVLLVVDYAESRKNLQALASIKAKVKKLGRRFRVVLLCREAKLEDGWLKTFLDHTALPISQNMLHSLSPLNTAQQQRSEQYKTIRHAFATVYQNHNRVVHVRQTLPIKLSEDVFENTLMLCILALADIENGDLTPLHTDDALLDYAKRREKQEYLRLCQKESIKLNADTVLNPNEQTANPLEAALACVILGVEPKNTSEVCELLTQCGFEKFYSLDKIKEIEQILHQQYGSKNNYLRPIQPDRVQEYWIHSLRDIDRITAVATIKSQNDTSSIYPKAVEMLNRLCQWQNSPTVALLLQELWHDDLLEPAFEQCENGSAYFGQAFAKAIRQKASVEQAKTLLDLEQFRANAATAQTSKTAHTFLQHHTVYTPVYAAILEKLLQQENLSAKQKAEYYNNLSVQYSYLGQRKEALTATREAAEIRRILAAENPKAFNFALTRSMINLGNMYSELGQREEALIITREAVELHRTLAAENPRAFNPVLARSLNNLGVRYSAMGQREDALKATREAVELHRTLAAENPRAFNPDLASSLNNLGIWYSEMGQREEALTATREGLELYRTLAAENPRAFNPDLASSLNNLGVRYNALGQREEALTATREGLELYRTLAAENPQAFNPDLAMSLNNLGIRYSEMGQREEALAATREAVELRRTLATENPRAFNPDLAMSLNNLGNRYKELEQTQNALKPYQQAVELIQPFASALPEVFQQRLQMYTRDYLNACQALGITPDAELAQIATQPNPAIAQLIAQMLGNLPPEQARELAPLLEHIQHLAQSDPQGLQELLQQLQDSQD